MKIIHLMRHAKAEEDRGQEDINRALTDRGVRAAALIGLYMQQQKISPDIILCSNAARTKQTAERVLPFLTGAKIEYDGALYHAAPQAILDQVSQIDGQNKSVMVVGHNPGIHELAARLARAGSEELIDKLAQGFPTASFVSFEVDVQDWSDITIHTKARLVRFVTPDELV
jgi:phosphohistidine phosphatase